MSLQVLVTFPGSMTLGAFEERVKLLTKMGCSIHLGTDLTQPIGEMKVGKVFKAKAAKDFNALLSSKEEPLTTEELSEEEMSLLDQGLQITHETGNSPLLDAMTAAKVGKLKPNMSREIVAYYQENPGHTTAQAAGNLANKFEAHYHNINDAFTHIRNLINTMCHAKGTQKSLEKRGGKPGRGNDAQVFALI